MLSELDSHILEENRKNLNQSIPTVTKEGVLEINKYLVDVYGLKYAIHLALNKLHSITLDLKHLPTEENIKRVYEEIKDKF
nr:MAG TPA: Protein of unknown function (DUF2730) [Caudoviricetes sp.]